MLSKNNFKLIHLTSYPFCCIMLLRWLHSFWIMSTYSPFFAWRSFNLYLWTQTVHRHSFLEVFLNPCTDFHDRITPSLNAVAPEGPKIMDMHYWILVSSLVHRDFSKLKGSFDYIMCCRWWDIQIQLFTGKHYSVIVTLQLQFVDVVFCILLLRTFASLSCSVMLLTCCELT